MDTVNLTVRTSVAEPAWPHGVNHRAHAAPARKALVQMRCCFPSAPSDELPLQDEPCVTRPSLLGMPEERLARVAARQAFVEMKTCFMRAASKVDGHAGATMLRELRLAREVTDLWRLSPALLSALPQGVAEADIQRHEVLLQLESAFPEGAPRWAALT